MTRKIAFWVKKNNIHSELLPMLPLGLKSIYQSVAK